MDALLLPIGFIHDEEWLTQNFAVVRVNEIANVLTRTTRVEVPIITKGDNANLLPAKVHTLRRLVDERVHPHIELPLDTTRVPTPRAHHEDIGLHQILLRTLLRALHRDLQIRRLLLQILFEYRNNILGMATGGRVDEGELCHRQHRTAKSDLLPALVDIPPKIHIENPVLLLHYLFRLFERLFLLCSLSSFSIFSIFSFIIE